MMTRLRWGILSTSNFAQQKILPALQTSEHAVVSAVASRNLSNAQAVAAQFGVERAYGAYEDLLADKTIDVVYVPLPNHLHVPWSIKALEAGKHVLCEKPIAISANQAQQLVAVAGRFPKLKAMEAFMYRFHPQWQHAKRLVDDGDIGELRTVHSIFAYSNKDPRNIRNQQATGGGGLLDIGCYGISLSRFLFGAEPKRVFASVEYDPEFHVDFLVSGMLAFKSGIATFTCSTQLALYQRVHILGTTGGIEIEIPFNASSDQPSRIWRRHDGQTQEIQFPPCNQYTIQADQFSLAILNDAPVPTPLSDAVHNMKVVDAVFESGKRNAWVPLS